MKISYSNELINKALGIINIKMPFTEKQLKISFIKLMKENHPDKNQNNLKVANKKTQLIGEAYTILKDYASSSDNDMSNEDKIFLKQFDKDPFKVYTNCSLCNGEGSVIYSENHGCQKICCPNCGHYLPDYEIGPGYHTKQCPKCKGTGKFKLRNGKEVDCRNCNGKGNFTQICYTCNGEGYYVKYNEVERPCPRCDETGLEELILDNPVLIPSAILT